MRFLLSLLLLALALPTGGQLNIGNPFFVSGVLKPPAAGGGPSYIFDEDCEGTGTPSGWTIGEGTPNWDSTATVLEGAQSLLLSGARSNYDLGSPLDSVWIRFDYQTDTVAGPYRVFSFRNQSGDSELCWVEITSENKLGVNDGSGTTAATADSLSTATHYRIWARYTKGSGSDSVMEVGFSTDDTEPTSGTKFASFSNGTDTSQCNRLQFRMTSGGNGIYDRLTAEDEDIGSF